MLIVHGISPAVVGYYLHQPHPGVWSPAATRHLGLRGDVTAPDLKRVLEGRHPGSGRYLPTSRPARRRAGYDLVFAAPKSVSLLGGEGGEGGEAVGRAHEAAVIAVLGHIEAEMGMAGSGLISASFAHRESAAGQPHLHTHVLVANLARSGPGWTALPSARIWEIDRTALTGLYQLDLRHQLELAGYRLDWRLGEHGLADVAAVPRSSVRAASAQQLLVGQVGRVEARRQAVPAPWPSVEIVPSRSRPAPHDGLERRVATRLGSARSDFRRADVFDALAACHPGGLSVDAAEAWVDRFCAAQVEVPSPTSRPRWATAEALRIDGELRELLVSRGGVEIQSAAVGDSALLAQAELVSRRMGDWSQERVVVDTRDDAAAERWRALTGLDRRTRGSPADVVVVDGADRRTTTYLLALARSTTGRLVLVEGGTMARLTNPTSHGARDAADLLGRVVPPTPEPWRIGPPTVGRDGPQFGREAAERTLGEWHAAGRRGLLVGLGRDEAAALNRAARADPDHYTAGDPVIALRRGAGVPAFGTIGSVTATAPLGIEWSDGSRSVLGHGDERRIGPAWAVTASVARRLRRQDLYVLGRQSGLDLIEGRRPTVPGREPPGLGL